ncbi:MAG: O-antigen ligase family protein, partial [Planctomycetota bacterium]
SKESCLMARLIALCLLLVAAPALGLVLRPGAADPGTAPGAGTRASREAEWSTTRVRLRLYPAVLRLARHELPIGTGAGNFRVEFPPFRDPEEILISSHGGAFETRVETAHSDPLQVLAELGLPGALCLLMFLLALYRSLQSGRLGTAGLASMLAFLPVTLFRSALWNGPAALAWVAGLALAHEPGRLARMRGLAPVGLLLCLLGVPALLGESHGARFLRAQQKRDLPGVLEALDRAVLLDPFETRWRVLRAQIRRKNRAAIQDSNLEELAEELEEVLERRPNDVDALAELAWLGLDRAELRPRGSRALGRLLAIYPSHRAALELRRDYAELRLALEGLAGKEKRAESRAAARRFLGRHPSHPGAMRLAMEHAFLAGDSREGLALLANLGSTSLVEEKLRQVRARAVESEGERLTALLSLQLQLQGLLNELKKKQ